MTSKSFKHWGVKGMHWGVRKAHRNASEDFTTARSIQGKSVDEMSNQELKTLTTRLQLEKQFRDLTRTEKSTGRKLVDEILLDVAKEPVKAFVKRQSGQLFKLVGSAFEYYMTRRLVKSQADWLK
jgi:hypothetical protein